MAINPSVALGCTWPPLGVITPSARGVPLANTALLLVSGATLTVSHHCLLAGRRRMCICFLAITLALALAFIGCQLYEYSIAAFRITDSAYGAVFYSSTGLHGG